MNKRHIVILFILTLALGGLIALRNADRSAHQAAAPAPRTASETPAETSVQPAAAAPITREQASTTAASPIAPCGATATLTILSAPHAVCVSATSTVLGIMQDLFARGEIVYAGRDYPGLGFFVETINGEGAPSGSSWILYINGKPSDIGASGARVKPGDTALWRIEKSY